MKTNLLTTAMLAALLSAQVFAQGANSNSPIDSLANFNQQQWINFYWSNHTTSNELPEFIYAHQRDYIRDTYFSTQRILQAQIPRHNKLVLTLISNQEISTVGILQLVIIHYTILRVVVKTQEALNW